MTPLEPCPVCPYWHPTNTQCPNTFPGCPDCTDDELCPPHAREEEGWRQADERGDWW